jgi:hypothetical protein
VREAALHRHPRSSCLTSPAQRSATMGAPEHADVLERGNVIFPRRKQGQHKKHGRKEGVVVTMDILETVFHMPLHKACKALVR